MNLTAIFTTTILATTMAAAGGAASAITAPEGQLARRGVCMREWAKFARAKPLEQMPEVAPIPKEVHNVTPGYPELPAGTRARGVWVGESD